MNKNKYKSIKTFRPPKNYKNYKKFSNKGILGFFAKTSWKIDGSKIALSANQIDEKRIDASSKKFHFKSILDNCYSQFAKAGFQSGHF